MDAGTDELITLEEAAEFSYIDDGMLRVLTMVTHRIPYIWSGHEVYVRIQDVRDFFKELFSEVLERYEDERFEDWKKTKEEAKKLRSNGNGNESE